jgi:proteasome lid subunit RPN8/RPN11
VVKITRKAFESFLAGSRSFYPKEFLGLWKEEDGVLVDIILLPMSEYGMRSATYNPLMLPLSSGAAGSCHSHPGPSNRPSKADIMMFSKTGGVHAIARYPFAKKDDVSFYDSKGKELDFEIV